MQRDKQLTFVQNNLIKSHAQIPQPAWGALHGRKAASIRFEK